MGIENLKLKFSYGAEWYVENNSQIIFVGNLRLAKKFYEVKKIELQAEYDKLQAELEAARISEAAKEAEEALQKEQAEKNK
jgi:hypothetical protein